MIFFIVTAVAGFVIGLLLGLYLQSQKINDLKERNASLQKRLSERRKTIEINNLDLFTRDLDFPNRKE